MSSNTNYFFLILFLFIAISCGVKSDPLPPPDSFRLGAPERLYMPIPEPVLENEKTEDEEVGEDSKE